MIKHVFLVIALITLTACKVMAPVTTPHAQIPASYQLTSAQVKNTLLEVLSERRWDVQRITDTQIFAKHNKQDRHDASIVIDYSSHDFTIRYQDSHNMKYGNGMIHRNYNRWVETIRIDFNRKLNIN